MKVTDLRNIVRDAATACGARGFVRFAPAGEALLVTDAAARCGGGEALIRALERAGFACRRDGTLLWLIPEDALLRRLCAREARTVRVDWESPLHPAQALAARLLRRPDAPLTAAGRALVLETARLLWRPRAQALLGMGALYAKAAALLRERDTGGLHLAGALLANWCDEQHEQHEQHKEEGENEP